LILKAAKRGCGEFLDKLECEIQMKMFLLFLELSIVSSYRLFAQNNEKNKLDFPVSLP